MAKQFLIDIQKNNVKDSATVVGLFGELGAGKTTFTKALAMELGVKETVTSPTFIIQKKYNLPATNKFTKMVHVDAYRLENSKELEILDWDQILKEKKNFVCIEWAEKVTDVLPKDTISVNLSVVNQTERNIEW